MNKFILNAHQTDICATCGTRFASPKTQDDNCPICLDERQYVGDEGQVWCSYNQLAEQRSIRFTQLQENLYALEPVPNLAIGQKAHLVLSASGNVLWDCFAFLDAPTVAYIRSLGGIKAIAISHPHYYTLMVEWAAAFNCPVYLHQNDQQWVMHSSEHVRFWSGETLPLWDGIQVVQTGGHFSGSTVLHLPHHGNKGILLIADTIYVSRDKKSVSFMYSYPNFIPLPQQDIRRIRSRVEDLDFDAVYGAFEGQIIPENAKAAVQASAQRYLAILQEQPS